MRREDLSPEKQKEYDSIVDEMMKDIEKQQKENPLPPGELSCTLGNTPYTEAQKKYIPRLQALFK